MDTRTKIREGGTPLEATAGARTLAVTGYFDPLTAAHARRLKELRAGTDRLVAVVLDPPEPLLSARARAELVAALECVDAVVVGPCDLSGVEAAHEEEADEARRRALVERVRQRHEAARG